MIPLFGKNKNADDEMGNTENGFYSIVAPGTIYNNCKYNVAVTVHKAVGPCQFKIGIKGPSFEEYKTVEVPEMTTQILEFYLPKLKEGDYKLIAEGRNGIIFKEVSKELNYSDNRPMVFIQTDKATYKPGDLVQFRVLMLDKETKPAKIDQDINIAINDGEENRLKYWKNVELKKGVYTNKYQLSEQPVLGQWCIKVFVEGQIWERKAFEVEKYVLPKFSASIETAKDVAITDGVINVTVYSKYTYGKPVKGKAVVNIRPAYLYCGMIGDGQRGLQAEKTIEVNGKGQAVFKLGEDLQIESGANRYMPMMTVTAVMEEDFTGNKQEAPEASVQLHKYRHRFELVEQPDYFKPEQSITLRVSIKTLDNTPVIDDKNIVKLKIEKPKVFHGGFIGGCIPPGIQTEDPKIEEEPGKHDVILESNLDENGIATFCHTFAKDCDSYYHLKCEYLGSKGDLTSLNKDFREDEDKTEIKELKLLTQKPKIGEPIEIELKSGDAIPYCVYSVVNKGVLIKTEIVQLPENTKSYIIKLLPTFEMIPKVSIFVHYITGKDLLFEETTVHFEQQLANTINISAPAETQPSEDVVINIQSDPESYVGLLGVDQSVLILRSGNDLTKDQIFNTLQKYDCMSNYGFDSAPGSSSGLVTVTNAKYPVNSFLYRRNMMAAPALFGGAALQSHSLTFGGPRLKKRCAKVIDSEEIQPELQIQIRKEFPENWIFEDIESLDSNNIVLNKKMPDTITSWVITGFAVNPETGIAVTENPATIKTFRPFFIGTNLPYSIKRGEQFSVPIIVFNYTEDDLDADVTLDNADDEFDFVDPADDDDQGQEKRSTHLTVSANNGATVNFKIRPKRIGNVTLKITATSPIAGDAVHKELKVEPEGITIYKNRDFYLHAEEGELNMENTVNLMMPEKVVPDSEFIEVAVMGNILGSTITNIDKLVRMPYGCGEQNMVNFVPNILVLWYLQSIDELSSAIEEKAKRFLEIGYQRELTYKHDNGSYSAFGKSDAAGSTWLTAYVMRSFHQAKKYIDIDNKILQDGLNFLANEQSADGSFVEKGRLFDFAHMNEMGLTAFVLLAFLENAEFAERHNDVINRGFEYLEQNVGKCEDLYALAVVLYALQQRKLESVHEILAKLETFARIDGGHKWWSKEKEKENKELFWHARSNDVEITGYILLTLLDMNVSCLPITKWLISQRNSNGGFNSTQETVVGLWALIKFAEKIGAAKPDMSIKIKSDVDVENEKVFQINKENSLVLQSLQLPKQTREITFNGSGTGTSILQVSYRYNISEKDSKPTFKLHTKINRKSQALLNFDVFAQYAPIPNEDGDVESDSSNMAVLEVALPSGYIAVPESFDKIKEVSSVKRVETKNENTSVIVYFDNLKACEEKCIPIEAELAHEVSGQKPVPIVIYDYYDDQKRASDFYEI